MTTTVHGPGDPTPQTDVEPENKTGVSLDATEGDEAFFTSLSAVEEPEIEVASVTIVDADGAETDIAHLLNDEKNEPLFDPAPFKTATPVFDNLASDKLIISLGGPIELDPTDPEDIALFENFMLGRSVNLQVHGSVVGKAGTYKEDADGQVTVTGKAGVKIHSLTLQGS